MRHLLLGVMCLLLAGSPQTGANDRAAKLLGAARTAMGGDALTAVKTLTASGSRLQASDTGSRASTLDLALELPDKFVEKEELANVMGLSVMRTRGFNGSTLINILDQPSMGNGQIFVRPTGSAGTTGPMTPADKAADDAKQLALSRQEFARLTLGMFAASFPGYPVTFTGGGVVQATDGDADVVDATAEGWTAKLYFDTKTHRPLMVSWMDKEPLVVGPGATGTSLPGGASMQTFSQGMSSADREQLMREMDARRQDAEARRRVVEYRVYYRDFKTVDGVTIPTIFTQAIEGRPSSELQLGKIKLNAKIDPKRFSAKH